LPRKISRLTINIRRFPIQQQQHSFLQDSGMFDSVCQCDKQMVKVNKLSKRIKSNEIKSGTTSDFPKRRAGPHFTHSFHRRNFDGCYQTYCPADPRWSKHFIREIGYKQSSYYAGRRSTALLKTDLIMPFL